jgi:hypothetical protein
MTPAKLIEGVKWVVIAVAFVFFMRYMVDEGYFPNPGGRIKTEQR